jgi:PAS domain S-box-containing protein
VTEDEPCAVPVAADAINLTRAEEIRLRYAAIVESSDDAIIAKTLDGVISAWNAAAQRMFGYTEHEAIGEPIRIIIPPSLYAEEQEILRRLRAGERVSTSNCPDHLAGERINVSDHLAVAGCPGSVVGSRSRATSHEAQAEARCDKRATAGTRSSAR